MGPWSVTDKRLPSPSGDAHDYFSLSRYYHPNPDTADGLPYVARDGVPNPELDQYDLGRLARLVHTVQLLSIAYGFSRDARYADRAAELLRVWFIDDKTRMNPHMTFAQYIPGIEGVAGPPGYPPRRVEGVAGRGVFVSYGGAIEGSCLPLLLDALRVFEDAPEFTKALWQGLRAWFSAFLNWLLESPLGQDEKNTRNNHALWYRVQVCAYALFTGREALVRETLEGDLPGLLDAQMAEDGSLPEECWRAIPFTYICFAMFALMNLAKLGERVGVKGLWERVTPGGRSIRLGGVWLARHILGTPFRAGGLESKERMEALARMFLSAAMRFDSDPLFREAWGTLPDWPKEDERGLVFAGPEYCR
ncbi:MAG: alginate lyase family protein [Verrucomicrobia bacterium]|nr:alginate lyase family protein [Verrucomicrobiota bacterium]MCH8527424.1 alginate lyase family protein [Kiritimatiellia bacterium]